MQMPNNHREIVFASLQGHRITVVLKDGAKITGLFSHYGNQALFPSSWSATHLSNCAPKPENVYAYISPSSSFSSRSPSASSSSSCSIQGGFDLYHSEARISTVKRPGLWLRCACLLSGDFETRSGSRVFDWLVVLWSDIACLEASNIPDDDLRGDEVKAFLIDGEISSGKEKVKWGHELLRWEIGETEENETEIGEEGGLEPGVLDWPPRPKLKKKKKRSEWDQFTWNLEKFGVRSTYVEGMYSTTLDLSLIPEEYRKHADKLAASHINRHRRPFLCA
eukprot:Protomagalhaensia_wolfi_Nauph_80__2435@NODE_260_length_3034_cov_120_246411_g194_i0_p2_GENE_NODE_260_length_3034_cov_120_246411_g194_i0NODE_260_length_3034_cov_120_246411_g194_i0_p2_ORF_typecomplete_len279_score34_78LsmAD/PF06741_13/1_1e05SMATX/PF14438_6/0_011SMATX/PF14438_6/8_4e02LSM/PF01423_22/0_2_NODE_260_length_3034_cov_120_246411_g194_i016692505